MSVLNYKFYYCQVIFIMVY